MAIGRRECKRLNKFQHEAFAASSDVNVEVDVGSDSNAWCIRKFCPLQNLARNGSKLCVERVCVYV